MSDVEQTASMDAQASSSGLTKTLTAQCYCKSAHFTITVPVSILPLPVHLCHCHVCRYTSGMLSCFHTQPPATSLPQFIAPSSPANLTGYVHGALASATRFFCSTCGCHIGDEDLTADPSTGVKLWRVATSIFANHTTDFAIRSHWFTRDSPGPGLHTWLPSIGDRVLAVRNPEVGDPEWPIPPNPTPKQEFDAAGRERLRAECHCGGVSFTIPRPTHPEVVADAYFRKWVSPLDSGKWIGALDLCDDCRLHDGSHVVPWTFAPLRLMEPRIEETFDGFGTLKSFVSSEGVRRAFCGTCGATVFYSIDSRAPTKEQRVVDIAVGILRAPEGTIAENWLTWMAGRVAFKESGRAFDKAFADAFVEGVDKWGKEVYGESPTLVVDGPGADDDE